MDDIASTSRTFSDEPARVARIVDTFFSGQSGSAVSSLANGTSITLLAGADAKDDCGIFSMTGPVELVYGSDYVRGPKFALYEKGLLSNFDIGYYVVVANVSDIAAMGAIPIGITTIVRYSKDLDDQDFEAIIAGIHQACADLGTLNIGGDIGGAERIILSASAIGVCEPGGALRRSGAHPGDLVCVTGAVGTAGAAVVYFSEPAWRGRLSDEAEAELLGAWKRPVARVAEGRILASKSFATSCQDVSDGLKATLEQLGEASEVGFRIDADAVPVQDSLVEVAGLAGLDPVALALSASVDFQLVFTIDPASLERCRKDFENSGLSFFTIGEATAGGAMTLRRSTGEVGSLPGVAWRHQSGDIGKLVPGGLSKG